jgi:hypothetical protein
MNLLRLSVAVLLGLALAMPAFTDPPQPVAQQDGDGFVPMFNGKDLTGWVSVNGAPGTFFVKDNQIITTGRPTGYLRTDKQYENFIAEFDWMHIPNKPGEVGNSGFFVWADPIPAIGSGYTRGIEVQVLVNLTYKNKQGEITATSQGDLFSIWGATCVPERPHPDGWARCLPSENHCKGEGEWNHYRVEANDGVIKLAVNGHFVSSVSKCTPRKGYLALESEGSECRFKNLKIKELPTTNPKKDEICDVAQGHRPLYTGLDLSGWQAANEEVKKRWQPHDTVLRYAAPAGAIIPLRTEKEYGDAEFIVDYRFPAKKETTCTFSFQKGQQRETKVALSSNGKYTVAGKSAYSGEVQGFKAGQWNRLQITLKGTALEVRLSDKFSVGDTVSDAPTKGTFELRPDGPMDFANLFVRELK